MNAKKLTPLFLLLCTTLPATAKQFGDVEVSGFLLQEVNKGQHHSLGLSSPSTYDVRGIDTGANLNQPGPSSSTGINTNIQMLTLGYSHEFDSAIKIEAKATKRWRNGNEDVGDQPFFERYMGASHPNLGAVKIGTQMSRTWSRSDSFTYPLGLSSKWSESGAGYNILPKAIRYTSPQFEGTLGKLNIEFTYAYNDENPLNTVTLPYAPWGIAGGEVRSTAATNTVKPRLFEFFAQFSKDKHLIEYTFQHTENAWQSSWGKGALVGGFGNPDTPGANSPRNIGEDVHIFEGDWYFKENWRLTYGLKRNSWSGAPSICDFNTVPTAGAPICSWPYPGFNYGSNVTTAYEASSIDAMLGAARFMGPWTFTGGLVYLGKGRTDNDVNWGQDNSAVFANLGAYRKIPEIYKDLTVYAQLEHIQFSKLGPAPLSMPNNTAYFVDSRAHKSSNAIILGAKIVF